VPIAIWREGGNLQFVSDNGKDVEPARWADVWTRCVRHPIAHDLYKAVVERGEPWPDALPPDAEAPALSNNGPKDESLRDQLDAVRRAFDAWLKEIGGAISTQEQADKAGSFAERIQRLEKEIVEAFRAEKDPIVKMGREVDEKWRDLQSTADAVKRRVKDAIGSFLKAEKARRDALAAAGNVGPDVLSPPRARGGGKTVALRTRKFTRFTDLKALLAHYSGDVRFIEHQGVHKALMDLATVDLAASLPVPGAEIATEEVAA
jgi:hypothetical protein